MLVIDGVSSNNKAADEDTSQHRHEITNIHRHDSQHPMSKLEPRHRRRGMENLQQICNSHNNRIQHRPHRINAEPPRPDNITLPLHDDHRLLDAILRKRHLLRLGAAGELLGQRDLAVDDDVASLCGLVEPSRFLDVLEGEETPADDGEDHEEDARSGVGACAGGRPGGGEEGGSSLGLEDHGHDGRAGGAVVHACFVSWEHLHLADGIEEPFS